MGQDPIWLDDVRCSRNDSSLLSCRHSGVGVHDCDHDEDVGVICVFGKSSIACAPTQYTCALSLYNTVHCNYVVSHIYIYIYMCLFIGHSDADLILYSSTPVYSHSLGVFTTWIGKENTRVIPM